MRSMQEEGLRLVREAESIFKRDALGALNEKDFNMVVRRAQEAVELALKGGLKIMGVDYPKVHDDLPFFQKSYKKKGASMIQRFWGGLKKFPYGFLSPEHRLFTLIENTAWRTQKRPSMMRPLLLLR